eukprot:1140418-Prymnesium_polylepis.4
MARAQLGTAEQLSIVLNQTGVAVKESPLISLLVLDHLPPGAPSSPPAPPSPPASPLPPTSPPHPAYPPLPPLTPHVQSVASPTELLDALTNFGELAIAIQIPPGSSLVMGTVSIAVPRGCNLTIHGTGATVAGTRTVSTFTVGAKSKLTLHGLTITHAPHPGRAVSHCDFSAVLCDAGGAVAVSDGATAELISCTVRGCSAVAGGGLLVTGTGSLLCIVDSTISECTSAADGGGIMASDRSCLRITSTKISHCKSSLLGGGIYANGAAQVVVTGTELASNMADDSGGGISLDGEGSLCSLSLTIVAHCEGRGASLYSGCGAIVLDYGSSGVVRDSVINECHAPISNVGAVVAMRAGPGGLSAVAHVINTVVTGCTAARYTGASMAMFDYALGRASLLQVDGGIVRNCSAGNGGAAFQVGWARWNNTLISGCTADAGGGFAISSAGQLFLVNVTGLECVSVSGYGGFVSGG